METSGPQGRPGVFDPHRGVYWEGSMFCDEEGTFNFEHIEFEMTESL